MAAESLELSETYTNAAVVSLWNMASLASHRNVWSTCLELLSQRGWILRCVLSPADEEVVAWVAEKGDIDLVADNPIELLGLSALHDEIRPPQHRPYWWVIAPADKAMRLTDRLLEEALATRHARVAALRRLREADPGAWIDTLRTVLENSGSADDAAAQLDIPTAELRSMMADPRVAAGPSERG